MNKDRRTIAGVLAAVLDAYSGKALPRKIMLVVRDEVKALQTTEQRSVQKMEGFKDNESTRINYRNGVECLEDLTTALEHLEEDEHDECAAILHGLATPAADSPQNTAAISKAPIKRARRRA